MAEISFLNNVIVESTTNGTGTLTQAGDADGYQVPPADANGKTFLVKIYAVNSSGKPTGDWELTESLYTHSGTTWSRGNFVGSSTGSRISFASGTKRIAVVLPTRIIEQLLKMGTYADQRDALPYTSETQFFVAGSGAAKKEGCAVKVTLDNSNFDFSTYHASGNNIRVQRAWDRTLVPYYLPSYLPDSLTTDVWVRARDPQIGHEPYRIFPVSSSSPAVSSFANTFQKLQPTAGRTRALYRFDDASGTTAVDSSGNGLTMTLMGAPTWGAELGGWNYGSTAMPTGASLQLNGTSQYGKRTGLLDTMPPCCTIAFRGKKHGTANFGASTIRSLFYKRWMNTPNFIHLFVYGGALSFGDRGIGNVIGTASTWTQNEFYSGCYVITPTSLRAFVSDPVTKTMLTVIDTPLGGHNPAPDNDVTDTRRYHTYPGNSLSDFIIGANVNASNVAQDFCEFTFDDFIIEDRAWTKQEAEARLIHFTNYIPNEERSRWVRSAVPSISTDVQEAWQSGACGEPNLVFIESTQRLHAGFTGGTNFYIGTAFSDNYGAPGSWKPHPGNPQVGNGSGGEANTAAHSFLHYDDPACGGDGKATIFYTQETTPDFGVHVFAVRAANVGEFTGFGSKVTVLTNSTFTSSPMLYNVSVTQKCPDGYYYMTCDAGLGGVFRTVVARSTTLTGTYTAVLGGAPITLPGTVSGGGGAATLSYNWDTGQFHLDVQTNLPCEVSHFTNFDPTADTWSAVESNPVIVMDLGDGTTTGYKDQAGDPTRGCECRKPDGSIVSIKLTNFVNNLYTATGDVYTHEFQGQQKDLNTNQQRVVVIPRAVPLPSSQNITYAATVTPVIGTETTTIVKVGQLTGNITINAPTGTVKHGKQMVFQFQQDATGGRTFTWNAIFQWTDDVTAASVTTTASKYSEVLFRYHSGRAKWVAEAINNG